MRFGAFVTNKTVGELELIITAAFAGSCLLRAVTLKSFLGILGFWKFLRFRLMVQRRWDTKLKTIATYFAFIGRWLYR